MIVKLFCLVGSALAQDSWDFWRFTFIEDVAPHWAQISQLKKKTDVCNFRADGEIVVFFCSNGDLSVSPIETYEQHSVLYSDFLKDSSISSTGL